jgi:uncharacterized protein (TIGR00255 family)
VAFDEPLARAYYAKLRQIQARFGVQGAVTLDHLLGLPIVSVVAEQGLEPQASWPAVRQTLQAALRRFVSMRRTEGARLVRDIHAHARAIRSRLKAIRARLPKSMREQQRRLSERIKALLGGAPSLTMAQIQEAAALIKEVDIHEELVRLESHLTHMEQALQRQQPVGKTLDFIAQELMREANTMGAKANDAMIARDVIAIKAAIEKIREQAQNLE